MNIEQIIVNDLNLRKKGNFYYCFSGTHADNNPSMSFWKSKNKFHCFSCGFNYDIYDHKRKGYKNLNVSYTQNIVISYSPPRHLNNFNNLNDYTINYFLRRKIDINVLKQLNIKQHKNYKTVVFPIYNEFGTHVSNKYRNVDTKTIFFDKNTNCKTFYNIQNIEFNRPIFITEGESDLLSALTAFKKTTFKNFISLVTGINSTIHPNMINLLKRFPEVILCFDNDIPGQNGSSKISNLLQEHNIKTSILNWDSFIFKDLNEILVNMDANSLKQFLISNCNYKKK